MAKKTVIKRALKYAPLKTEFVKAMREDESQIDFKVEGDDYTMNSNFDNIVEADYEEVDEETGEIKDK
jgi:recombination protein RecT